PPGSLLVGLRRPSAARIHFGPVFTPKSSPRPGSRPLDFDGFHPVFPPRRRESSSRSARRSFPRPKLMASVPPGSRTVEADAPPSPLVGLGFSRHRRQLLDHDHSPGATDWAPPGRSERREVLAGLPRFLRRLWFGRRTGPQQLAAQGQLLLAMAIGQEAVVADPHEPTRQDVEQQPPDELHSREGHGPLPVAVGRVLIPEADL